MILLPLYRVQIQNPYFGSELYIFHMVVSLTVFLNAALVLFHTFIRGKGSLKSIDI